MMTAALVATSATAAMAEGAKIFVIGGKADDPFWSKVKKGADDAGKVAELTGGSVTWLGPQNYDNLGPDAAKLIRTALSQNPSAIVGPDWVPEAMDDAFKEVVAAGVPLIIYNSGGMDAAKRLGAMNYVGNEEYAAGLGGGEYYGSHGAKNVLCVNTLPGATNTEDRCKGIADAIAKSGGKSSQLPLPSSSFGNPTAVAEAIKAAAAEGQHHRWSSSPSAPATPTAPPTPSARPMSATRSSSLRSTWTKPACSASRTARRLFSIDQQPYLQGYLAVSLLNGFVNYGLDLPTKPVLTGPGIVDAANVDATLAGAAAGAR